MTPPASMTAGRGAPRPLGPPITPTPLWPLPQPSAFFSSTFFVVLSDRAGCDGDGSSSLGPGSLERPVTFAGAAAGLLFGVWTSCNPSPVPPAGLSPGFPSRTLGGREGSRTSRPRPAGPSLSPGWGRWYCSPQGLRGPAVHRRLPRAYCGVLLPPGTPASPPGRPACAVITASFKEERRSSCCVGSSPGVNATMPPYFHTMTYDRCPASG